MFLTEKKLRKRIEELSKYRYREIIPLHSFCCTEDTSGLANPSLPLFMENAGTIGLEDRWKGRDKYLWLETTVSLPEDWRNKRAVGVFDFGMTGGGNNSGFESMLYIDGKPYQGVDSNHKEVFFGPEHFGSKIRLTFRLWSGLEGGGPGRDMEHTISMSRLAVLDEAADDLFYTADMMLSAAELAPESSPVRHDLIKALDRAFYLLDWESPGSGSFYDSVMWSCKSLCEALEQMPKQEKVTVSCIGHTHIDTAWLWRLKHTREKASRSFSSVLRLMKQFPEYYFLQTQPQIYEYIKEDFPEIYQEIRERAAEGRWEADGAMWVEADCNLTSGESLTRQLLMGRKFFLEEFGKEPEFLWLPDVFGYSWALPQILKKSGIEMFMTTKISWNQFNRLPHDTFWWKGMDGSQVLTHFITTPDPGQDKNTWGATYNGQLFPETVQGIWEKYRDKDVNRELLLSYGFGDGGGGVNRDMLERRRRLDRIPGLPNVKTSRARDYFNRLKESVKNTDSYVHTWDGELYLEYHRGTYTSQAFNKKTNRELEYLYRKAEWMAVMEGLLRKDFTYCRQEELTEGWKILLTHQFHDIIPGSSIQEVYEDSRENYRKAREIAEGITDSFYLCAKEEGEEPGEQQCFSVINPLGTDRDGMVWIEGPEVSAYSTREGAILEAQPEKGGSWVWVDHVPAMGARILCPAPKALHDFGTEQTFTVEELGENIRIETPFYRITVNGKGQIRELFDKENNRQVLPEGECANVFQVFEDKPLDYDAWDIDIFYQQKMEEVSKREGYEIKTGSLRMELKQLWQFGKSIIRQDMVLYARDRRIDFVTKVFYQERQRLLKTAFPVDVRSVNAVYDVQYGNVKRPNHWNTSWDMARFESVAHRWVDLSQRDYGVSLLNDCKYGHDIYGNVIRLTLLKGGIYPDVGADMGEHEFTYSLFPHKGDFVEGNTVPAAAGLNQPLEVYQGRVEIPGTGEGSMIRLEGGLVELDAVKKSEDGNSIVVRFHEYGGAGCRVKAIMGFPVKEAAECDLMERALEPFHETAGGEVGLEVRPYEIKTLLLKM